jgi:hypothetical protein
MPCSFIPFLLQASPLEAKIGTLILSKTWGIRDERKRREWSEEMTEEDIARLTASTESAVSHALPEMRGSKNAVTGERKDGWIGRQRGPKHGYQYKFLGGPVSKKEMPIPEPRKRHAKAKTAAIRGLTDIAARRNTLRLADNGPADAPAGTLSLAESGPAETCRYAPEGYAKVSVPTTQDVASCRTKGILQPECTLTLAGIPATPCLPKDEFTGINCRHQSCHLFKPVTEAVTAPAGYEDRTEGQATEPGSPSELYQRVYYYLAEKLERILREKPPEKIVRGVVKELEKQCATFEHFAAHFEMHSDKMSKKGNPIRGYAIAIHFAANCSTSDLVLAGEKSRNPKASDYAESRVAGRAQKNGDS